MPEKTHDVRNFAVDSRRWISFPFRGDDIVIATWGKSGTTWVQQIVGQLIHGPRDDLRLDLLSPWIEQRFTPLPLLINGLERQRYRRFVKTHLPLDALVYSPKAKYLFIGRDGRDVVRSLHGFHQAHSPLAYRVMNETPDLVGPPFAPPIDDFQRYFDDWLEQDGFPWWPFWSHLRSWWRFRDLPNLFFVHFNDLKADLPREINRIAACLAIEVSSQRLDRIVQLCTFDRMKANSKSNYGALTNSLYEGGMSSFFRAGQINEWNSQLSPAQIERYERRAASELPENCRAWLAGGRSALRGVAQDNL